MSQQLIINVSKPSILPSLRRVLAAMEGVSVERPHRRSGKGVSMRTVDWQDEPEVMASVKRGESDIANGCCRQMTASEVREMLGV